MLNQKLQQKLLQKLSPQQIQLIKLLEIPTVQLEQRIKKEIEENPVLEDVDMQQEGSSMQESNPNEQIDDYSKDDSSQDNEFEEFDDYASVEYDSKKDVDNNEYTSEDFYDGDDDTPAYRLNANNYSKDDEEKSNELADNLSGSLHEFLLSQIGLSMLNEDEQLLAEYIIGNIDEDGYLRQDLEDIVDNLAFSMNVNTTVKEISRILTIIQDFDPAGVGCRDLKECLTLQLVRRYKNNLSKKSTIKNALLVIRDYFDEFSKKHFSKIISKLYLSDLEMKQVAEEINKLNPKPGNVFNNTMAKESQHIIPDYILEDHEGEFRLQLNSKNVPELRINKTYQNMIDDYYKGKKQNSQDKETISFVKQKLDSAKWFIDAIKQRQNTLLITMQAIIDYQKEYFIDGDDTKLKPMILKDIAEKTKFDISTISRVANSKYIQTHFGIISLKFFFSEGMQTDNGEEVSTREIKKILKDCIDKESKKHPLTDEKLAEILQEKGYQIARRTVAKYREQMNILVARLRKEI